jgi:hypothetical protein
MSLTITLSKQSNELTNTFFPPIQLDDGNYEIGLLSFDTYNLIPNIDETNDSFYFADDQVAHIPKGTYEVESILKYMEQQINALHNVFVYQTNLNTFKPSIKCSVDIDFSKENSVGPLLGFKRKVYKANMQHTAEAIADIFSVHIIDVHCNISSGSYMNGVPSRSLHAFSTKVGAGFKIQQAPKDVIYLPVDVKQLEHLYVKIVDQAGRPVDFQNELITIRLHIRKSVS